MVANGGSRTRALLSTLAAVLVFATSSVGIRAQQPAMRWDGVVEHVSIAQNQWWPNPSGAARLSRHPMSTDGRWVTFGADVPNDPYPATPQLFRRDRLTGQTEMLIGAQAAAPPVISGDGNHYAFQSCDQWLRSDNSPGCDVYLIDVRYWMLVDASTALDGTLSDNSSSEPMLSLTGRYLVFRTNASALLPAGAAPGQIVLRDRDADGNGIYDEPGGVSMEVVSVSSTGVAGNAESESAEVSGDGRFVAFRSRASNLVDGDTNNAWDVFLRDRYTGETRRINVNPWTGQQATPTVDSPAISMTTYAEFIAFAADDGYLANPPSGTDDTNNALDVLVYDRQANSLTRIDVGAAGQLGDGPTYWPTFSEDGRYLSMLSAATIDGPVTPGRTLVYVHDRLNQTTTRVSVAVDGAEPNASAVSAAISGDGSYVAYQSPATNIAQTAVSGLDAVFGAAYFDVTPATLTIPSGGGEVTFTVGAQQYAQWNPGYFYEPWLWWTTPIWGQGNGSMTFAADRNPTAYERSVRIQFNSRTIEVKQEPGLSLTDLSPTSGPNTGGTVVTITGTGFGPDISFFVDRAGIVPAQLIDSTTAQLTMPPNTTGDAYIWACAPSPSYSCALLYTPFRYLDTTPPEIYPYVSGELTESGWYRSNVQIDWWVNDPETPWNELTTTGCMQTILTTDTAGTTFTCTATSVGGTSSASVTVRRDTTGPLVAISKPERTLYKLNQVVQASYWCSDGTTGTTSGVESCTGDVANGAAIDTSISGYRDFYAWGMDRAGNSGFGMRSYAVSTGQCTVRPQGLVAWWPSDYDYRDVIGGHDGALTGSYLGDFAAGISRGAMHFMFNDGKYVQVGDAPALQVTDQFTLSAWIFSGGAANIGVIAGREGEYLLGRGADGKIRYSIANTDPGWGWINTDVAVDQQVYTHLALTYDGTMVRLYKNGQLAYLRPASGPVGDAAPSMNDFRIGARQDPSDISEYAGLIDNVEVVSRALSDYEIQAAFLSADVGYCPDPTTLTLVPTPQRATYGDTTARLTAQLMRSEVPEPKTWVTFKFRGTTVGTVQTNANGVAGIDVTLPAGMSAGTYAGAVVVSVPASAVLEATSATADFVVDKTAPVLTWNTPAPIVYGTALGAQQLNASANVGGFYTYSPSSGTVLGAGSTTLSVTFTPSNPNYQAATAIVVLDVMKATPAVSATGGTFTYDGVPHAATGSVTGVGGASLGPLAFTYNGSSAEPTDAGTYAVVASFAGDANYNDASATATLTIAKAAATVNVVGGTFTYDGTAHPVTATVSGVGEDALGPVTLTYNGVPDVPVNAGSYAVVASFAGNGNYSAASATTTLTIDKAAPVMSASGGTYTYDGAPHAATATVTGVGGASLSPVTFAYNGASTDPVNAGTYSVVASFAGDVNYLAASAAATITIGKAQAQLTWDAPSAIVYGTALGAAQLNASASTQGTFSYTPSGGTVLGAGAGQGLTVTFTPADANNYVGASANTTITVLRAPLTIVADDATKQFGAPLPAFTARASGLVNGDSMASLSGVLAFSTPATASSPVGTYAVTPSGLGSSNYAIAFANGTLTVVRGSVAVALSTSPEPSGLNQPMTFTATVAAAAPAVGSPTGTVSFYDGSILLGTVSLSGGTASLTTAGLDAGTRTIEARYDGDASFATGSRSASHVIRDASGTPSIALTSSRNPSSAGQNVTLTATVTMASGPVSGTVQFYDGSTLLGAASLSATGQASLSISSLVARSHAIVARYVGMNFIPPAYSPVFVQVVGSAGWKNRATTTTLTASPNPATLGGVVALTATVTGSTSSTPTGRILIMVNGAVVGDPAGIVVTPGSGSTATVTLSQPSLAHGNHTVTATYLGDSTYKGSTVGVTAVVN